MSPEELARLFGVPLIDYRRKSDGVLIASGAGIMMAAMDEAPCFRWCIDADQMRWGPPWRIEWFMTALDRNTTVTLLGVAGWFSLDRPTYLQAGLRTIRRMRTVTYSGGAGAFDGEAASYGEFIKRSGAISVDYAHLAQPRRTGGRIPVPKAIVE